MVDELTSSRLLLTSSIQSHADLAKDLLNLHERDSGEGDNRLQIASLILFLAGVEKMLNIAFELLYIAGKVTWNEIVFKNNFEVKAGFLDCHKGLLGKIKTLEKLGADISPLIELVELRNYFIHDSNIYVGYAETLDEESVRPRLCPVGPMIFYPLPPSMHWNEEVVQYYTDGTVDVVSSFVDSTNWQRAWLDISKQVENLPSYEIDTALEYDPEGHEKTMARIEELNNEFIGIGLEKLLGSKFWH